MLKICPHEDLICSSSCCWSAHHIEKMRKKGWNKSEKRIRGKEKEGREIEMEGKRGIEGKG